MQRAQEARASLRQSLNLQRQDADLGCCDDTGKDWFAKEMCMYDQACHLVYNAAVVNHWNIVADPGHHAYKESLVSLVWNWEIKFGCYPKWQHLVPGEEE